MPKHSIITLLTDFGTRDPYVGAMCGAILAVNPEAKLVMITHEIAAHNLHEGSFTLACAAPYFPPHAVHLAVVDPGVGSLRRAMVLEAGAQLFVGPDNGLLTGVMDQVDAFRAFSIENPALGRRNPHPTFHGRDLFGPVAAHLSLGMQVAKVGPPLEDPVRLYPAPPPLSGNSPLEVRILHVDRFGNLITDLTPGRLHAAFGEGRERGLSLAPTGPPLPFRSSYSEEPGPDPFLLWSSSGNLELALNCARADERLALAAGERLALYVGVP